MSDKKLAVLAVSGGMDSTSLLLHLLSKGYMCHVLSFYYGQKHSVELHALDRNLTYLMAVKGLHDQIEYHDVDLSNAMSLFHSALTDPEMKVPEGHYAEENMKQTVVPNRNAIFSSLLFGYGLSLSTKHNTEVVVALGVHSGDHAIYPDCRMEFYDRLIAAFRVGNWGADQVRFYLPYMTWDKAGILSDALHSCSILGVDFDTILMNTNTCYQPDGYTACGKCGSCTERLEAFSKIGLQDPIKYAGQA